jgi:trimeric autotransporter adhesin
MRNSKTPHDGIRFAATAIAMMFISVGLVVTASAHAQCETGWDTSLSDPGFADETIYALAEFDGKLIAGGTFTIAGGQTVNHVAQWDGASWSALGSGLNGTVRTMHVHNGSLYVGGHFTEAGNVQAHRIARWDGADWHALGQGFNRPALAMTVHEGELFVGGMFSQSGQADVSRIARWDETAGQWQPVGIGVNRTVLALTSANDVLIAAGHFTEAGGTTVGRVAMWDGDEWQPITAGFLGVIGALVPFEGRLVAAGSMQGYLPWISGQYSSDGENAASPTSRIRVWDWGGEDWTVLAPQAERPNRNVLALHTQGDHLFAAGKFNLANDNGPAIAVNHIMEWTGEGWQPLGDGLGGMFNASANALATYDGHLVVAGYFATAGGQPATSIAMWNLASPAGPADLNGDGVVNVADLLILFDNWGTCDDPDDCPADLNGDGVVNIADLLILFNSWG